MSSRQQIINYVTKSGKIAGFQLILTGLAHNFNVNWTPKKESFNYSLFHSTQITLVLVLSNFNLLGYQSVLLILFQFDQELQMMHFRQ